jgi:hypothetical protein
VRVLEERMEDIKAQGRVGPFVLDIWEASHDVDSSRALYVSLLGELETIPAPLARRWIEFLRRHDLSLRPEEVEFTRRGLVVLAAVVVREEREPERLRQLAAAAHWLGLMDETAMFLEAHHSATLDVNSGGMALRIYRTLGRDSDAARIEARLRSRQINEGSLR